MTTQHTPSFDAECARLQKAADVANDLAHERYLTINAANAALDTAGSPRDLPLAGRVGVVVGEIRAADATNDRLLIEVTATRRWARRWKRVAKIQASIALYWQNEARRATAALQSQTSAANAEQGRLAHATVSCAAQLEETRRELSALLLLVGAETPIAAFDLVTTWRTEKAGYQEEIAALRKALDAQTKDHNDG